MRFLIPAVAVISFISVVPCGHSQNLGFDLAGPPVDVKVEHEGKTLPIAEVPYLEAGDRIWIHPNFPDSQSVHYLLVVAFLRGSTNPPPDEWFTKAETWDKAVREEGIFVTVPKEAQQAMIFLAPQAIGDFSTLRSAVRGRPGAFVRSSQDLQQAGYDRARLERYLETIKSISENDPRDLQQKSVLLAHNLKMKLDEKCFDRPTEQQYACLTQNSDQLILDDANSQSMLARVSNGATADLMNQISYSRLAGGGAYSAYVGAIIDFGRIMSSLHNAQYQYIPALAVPRGDSLSLRLNNPPSFRKPQSVLVIALPPVQKSTVPAMRSLEPEEPYCATAPSPVLGTEAAPILFATRFAHDIFLRIEDSRGRSAQLPLAADPSRGGLVLKTTSVKWNDFDADVTGTVHGLWGFDPFQGPKFRLHIARSENWRVAPADETALVVGREDALHVSGASVSCVSGVSMLEADGAEKALHWQAAKPQTLEIKVPLEKNEPGPVVLAIKQEGLAKADEVRAQSYAEAAQFDRFTLNAGDTQGTLEGKRLDEVNQVELSGIHFEPAHLKRRADHDELKLKTQGNTDGLRGDQVSATVTLKDGRTLTLPASVLPPRPKVALISKGVQTSGDVSNAIHMGSDNELAATGRIVFSLKSVVPSAFPRSEQIEVASVDDGFHTVLTMADGTLVLQDSQTALAMIDPNKAFGISAFGPLRFRPVSGDGTAGDWQPLGTLVRLPDLKQVSCPQGGAKTCSLSGSNLFLLASVATDQDFENPTVIPDGFTGQSLSIPRPAGGNIYFKLRDDPGVVQSATLPVVREAGMPGAAAHTTSASKKEARGAAVEPQ